MSKPPFKPDEVGEWSILKLDIVEKYGHGYTTAFKNERGATYIAVSRRAAPAVRSAVDVWCQQQGLTLIPSHSADNIASGIALILTTHGFSLMPDYAGHLIPTAVIVRPLVDEPHPLPLLIAYRPKNPTPARFLVKAIIADWRPG